MNKNKYKLIFSKSKSCLIPVAENVQSAINNSSSDTDTSSQEKSVFNFKLNAISTFIQSTLLPIFAVSLLSTHSFANSVEVDGIKTKITTVGNDTLIIDIAKPEHDGISDNRFKEFNVTNGAVFNNSTSDGNSHLVGYVKGNALLEGQSAKVILNQVTGHNSTQLTGGLEVLGQKADLLIINPNGININGVQTRNTDRFIVSTSNVIDPQKGLNLDVDKGAIIIEENGLATDGLKYLDIVAKKITQKGAIKNHNDDSSSETNINLIAGSTSYDVVQQKITSKGEIVDEVIISGEELGAMHGKHIQFVTTDSGAGIKHSNIILSESDIKFITDNGSIDLHSVHSKNSIEIKKANQITLNNEINTKTILLDGQTTNIKTNAQVNANKVQLNMTESINLENNSKLSGVSVQTKAKQLKLTENAVLLGKNIVVNSSDIDNKGIIYGHSTQIDSNNLNNNGKILAVKSLKIITKGNDSEGKINGYKNSGQISSKGDAELIFKDNTNFSSENHNLPEAQYNITVKTNDFNINENHQLTSLANIIIESHSFKNKGAIISAKKLGIITNDNIQNYGDLVAKKGVYLSSTIGDINNYSDSIIYSEGQLFLEAQNNIYNLGDIFAKEKITASAVKFTNDAKLESNVSISNTFKEHLHSKYYNLEYDNYYISLEVPEFVNNLKIKNAGIVIGEAGFSFIQKNIINTSLNYMLINTRKSVNPTYDVKLLFTPIEIQNKDSGVFNYSLINIQGNFENNGTTKIVNEPRNQQFDLIENYLKNPKVHIRVAYTPRSSLFKTDLSGTANLSRNNLYDFFDIILNDEYPLSSSLYYARSNEIINALQGIQSSDFQKVMLLTFGQNWANQDHSALKQNWQKFKENKPMISFYPSHHKAQLFADKLTGNITSLQNGHLFEHNNYQRDIVIGKYSIPVPDINFENLLNETEKDTEIDFSHLTQLLRKTNLLIDRSFQQSNLNLEKELTDKDRELLGKIDGGEEEKPLIKYDLTDIDTIKALVTHSHNDNLPSNSENAVLNVKDIELKTHETYNDGTIYGETVNIDSDGKIKNQGDILSEKETHLKASKGIETEGRVIANADGSTSVHKSNIVSKGNLNLETDLNKSIDIISSNIGGATGSINTKDLNIKDTYSTTSISLEEDIHSKLSGRVIGQHTQKESSVKSEGSTLKFDHIDLNLQGDLNQTGSDMSADSISGVVQGNYNTHSGKNITHSEKTEDIVQLELGLSASGGGYQAGVVVNEKDGTKTGITESERFGLNGEVGIAYTKKQDQQTDLKHNNSHLSTHSGKLNILGSADIGGLDIDATQPNPTNTNKEGFELDAKHILSTKEKDEINKSMTETTVKVGLEGEMHSAVGDLINDTAREVRDSKNGLKQDITTTLQVASDVINTVTGDIIGGSVKEKAEISHTEYNIHESSDVRSHINGKVTLSSDADLDLKNVESDEKSKLSLNAKGDVNLIAGETIRSETTNSLGAKISAGGSVHCGVMSEGCAIGVDYSLEGSGSNSQTSSTIHKNTELKSDDLNIKAGGNLNLSGANIDANKLHLDVNGKTNIKSVQDDIKSETVSINASLGLGASINTELVIKPNVNVGVGIGYEKEEGKEVHKQSGITGKHIEGNLKDVNLEGGYLVDSSGKSLLKIDGKINSKDVLDSHHKDGGNVGINIGMSSDSLSHLNINGGRVEQKHYEATEHSTISGINNKQDVDDKIKHNVSDSKTVTQDDTVAKTHFSFETVDISRLANKGSEYIANKTKPKTDHINTKFLDKVVEEPIYEEILDNPNTLNKPTKSLGDEASIDYSKRPLPSIPKEAEGVSEKESDVIYAKIDKSPEAIAKANAKADEIVKNLSDHTATESEEDFAPLLPARPELKNSAGNGNKVVEENVRESLFQRIRNIFSSRQQPETIDEKLKNINYDNLEDNLNLKELIILENIRNDNFEESILNDSVFLDGARVAAKRLVPESVFEQMKNTPGFDEILTEGAKDMEKRINDAVTFKPTEKEFNEIQNLVKTLPKGLPLDIPEQTLHILNTLATTSETIKKSPALKEQLHSVIEEFLTESKNKALTVAMIEKLNYNLRPEEGENRILYKNESLTKGDAIFSSIEASQLQLAQTVDFINNAKNKGVEPSVLAALVYQRLIDYHPFADGNGRITRVITNKLLLDAGYSAFPKFDKTFEMRITPHDNERVPLATNSEMVQEFLRTLRKSSSSTEENHTPITDRIKDIVLKDQTRSVLQKLRDNFKSVKQDSEIRKVRKTVEQFDGEVNFTFSQLKGEVYSEIIKHIETQNGVCEAVCASWITKKVNEQSLWEDIYDQPKDGKNGKLNKKYFEVIKQLQTEFINNGNTATQQFTLMESWLSEQGVTAKERQFGSQRRKDQVEGSLSDKNLNAFTQAILDTGKENSAIKKISISLKDGAHTVSAAIQGENVVFFDPNFGELSFPSREKFDHWFKNAFWQQSGYAGDNSKNRVFNVVNYHLNDKE
ncbi:YopT-type cysteine protease domain-containing protein [Pasteurella atlantica]|uniref:YopT-type cysteine protease domain-containing protein n=2 Tax=Pasteurellaceae TaxID=712 RepID=A0ACC6HK74_9PAST|nr:YopT-type cysteine protease domain-containing protein [Pasteurella atlantica]MDP8051238.1 YopT-type cysteine protease domain-containing protein [Pasteurella atlantica]MDP8104533.1 YopT-type cysteine protease domain-containing protein [Pasteurella atlantica]MDP8147914.1 YopT-type cysteine protease domain-containing protein [Pasteurella atlantica]